jgi:hypothetical protein
MYSYREFKDILSKAVMSYEERLEKRNNDILTKCITESYKEKMFKPAEKETKQTE